MDLVLQTAGFLLLIVVVAPIAVVARALRRLELQTPGSTTVPESAVPEPIRAVITSGGATLAKRGFAPCRWDRVTPLIRTSGFDTWSLVLWSDSWRTFATLSTNNAPDPLRPVAVYFCSLLRDGQRLLTMNGEGWSVIGDDPRTELHDPYAHGVDAQWKAHADRLRALPPERHPVAVAPDEARRMSDADAQARIASMSAAGDLAPAAEGRLRFTWRGALRWAVRFRRRSGPYRRWLKEGKRRAAADPAAETPAPLLVDAFFRSREMERGGPARSSAMKSAVLAGTLALFALSFAGWFDTLGLAVLTAVLFFHELGHWVAMRVFGYRDTSIFFIPFFGAATSGENPDATATQRMLVYLLGPVPGILLGAALTLGAQDPPIAALWAAYPDVVGAAAPMLLWVNFFNLLPILPFDGGHIARLLVFARHPWSEVAFRVLALASLAAIALLLQSTILLVLTGVTVIALPHTLRIASLGRAIARARSDGARLPERSLVEHAFAFIEAGRMRALPYATKYALVRDALKSDSMPSPGWVATLFLGALYLVCLAVGPTAFAVPMVVATLAAAE